MRANVYALVEFRSGSADLYMVGGSYQEMIDYYTRIKGRPPRSVARTTREDHDVWILDEDDSGGAAMISQYKVGITEILD